MAGQSTLSLHLISYRQPNATDDHKCPQCGGTNNADHLYLAKKRHPMDHPHSGTTMPARLARMNLTPGKHTNRKIDTCPDCNPYCKRPSAAQDLIANTVREGTSVFDPARMLEGEATPRDPSFAKARPGQKCLTCEGGPTVLADLKINNLAALKSLFRKIGEDRYLRERLSLNIKQSWNQTGPFGTAQICLNCGSDRYQAQSYVRLDQQLLEWVFIESIIASDWECLDCDDGECIEQDLTAHQAMAFEPRRTEIVEAAQAEYEDIMSWLSANRSVYDLTPQDLDALDRAYHGAKPIVEAS